MKESDRDRQKETDNQIVAYPSHNGGPCQTGCLWDELQLVGRRRGRKGEGKQSGGRERERSVDKSSPVPKGGREEDGARGGMASGQALFVRLLAFFFFFFF